MSAINRARIGANLYKQLEKKGLLKEVNIKRTIKNSFNEKIGEDDVCTIKGYYHREEARVEMESVEAATINKLYNNKLLVICDDTSKSIQQDDYFILDNVNYQIIDLGNIEDIVFDMYLTRM